MTTVGFFDDDEFRNSEAMRALRKTVQESIAPALETIRQINAVNTAKMMESLQPVFSAATAEATKSIRQTVLSTIELPKFGLDLGTLRQIPLGDAAARETASSIDYTNVAASVATELDEPGPTKPVGIDPDAITEQELDEMTAELFQRRPDLAQKFYDESKLTTLDPTQLKMLAWQWALIALLGIALLFAWAKVDGNVDYAMDIASTATPIAAAAYVSARKELGADDKADKPEDKKEGA